MKTTLETSGEDVKITPETSGEDVKITLKTSGEDVKTTLGASVVLKIFDGENDQNFPPASLAPFGNDYTLHALELDLTSCNGYTLGKRSHYTKPPGSPIRL